MREGIRVLVRVPAVLDEFEFRVAPDLAFCSVIELMCALVSAHTHGAFVPCGDEELYIAEGRVAGMRIDPSATAGELVGAGAMVCGIRLLLV